jgi:GNAT superfamily N-acetyltransferase
MRGPASFSTNDECGLLIHGFDDPPALMMPYNPPYYVGLLEGAGFRKSKDLLAFEGGHPNPVPERSERAVERLRRRSGVEVRPIRPAAFAEDVERIKIAYNASWQRNWGFVPMSDGEIDHIAQQFRPIYVPDLVPFAEVDGQLVGFGLAIPDLNQFLVRNRSGRLFPVVLRMLWAVRRRKVRRMRILLLGILPEYRGRGVDAMLWQWIFSRGLANGFLRGEAGWILEDNAPMCNAAQRMGFEHSKTFRLYERDIGRADV